MYLEKPYYTAPINKGEKVYALLREALKETGKAGLARVVIHSKQHLAVVLPCGPALVLNLLRWGGEIRSWQDLPLPRAGKAGHQGRRTEDGQAPDRGDERPLGPGEFRDNFHDAIMKLVQAKAKAGDTATVEPLEEAPETQGAEVIDLTELLRRSLRGGSPVPPRPNPWPPARAARSCASRQQRRPHRQARPGSAAAPRRNRSRCRRCGKSHGDRRPPRRLTSHHGERSEFTYA